MKVFFVDIKLHKFLSFLDRKIKKSIWGICILLLVSNILELFSLSAVIPILADFSSSKDFDSKILDIELFKILILSPLKIKVLVLLGLVILKNIYQAIIQYKLSSLGYKIESTISIKLIRYFFVDKYSEKKSAELIKNCTSDAHRINMFYFIPLMIIFTDSILVIIIISFLTYFYFRLSLTLFLIFGFSIYLYHKLTGLKIINWGKKMNIYDESRINILNEIFHNFIFIKLINKSHFFIKKFNKSNSKYINSSYFQHSLQNVTRNFYEILIFVGFLILIITPSTEEKIITLGVFGLSVFKLMPSLNRITSNWNSLKFSIPVLSSLQFTPSKENESIKKIKFDSIQLKNISFQYEDSKDFIIKDLNNIINKGDFVGIMGKSGAGKSTLIKILMGFIIPTKGEILINKKNQKSSLLKISYVPQKVNLINDSITNNIAFGEENININRVNEVIKLADLDETIGKLPNGLNTFAGELGTKLSGGQIQRIGIARALYNNPELIIFDESTNSLDEVSEKMFFNTISKLNNYLTIIFISHNTNNHIFFSKKIYL